MKKNFAKRIAALTLAAIMFAQEPVSALASENVVDITQEGGSDTQTTEQESESASTEKATEEKQEESSVEKTTEKESSKESQTESETQKDESSANESSANESSANESSANESSADESSANDETETEVETVSETETEVETETESKEHDSDTLEDFYEQIREVLNDTSLDSEEKQEKIAQLKAGYGTAMKTIEANTDEMRASGVSTYSNEWLEVAIDRANGRFTFGTKEGNPNYTSDNNKLLLYGHPSPSTSETYIYIQGLGRTRKLFFKADSVRVDTRNGMAYADMYLEEYGISITQKLEFIKDSQSGREDTVKISYFVTNDSDNDIKVGIRIMLDTMLNMNDDAPFKIPGIGNLLHEKEFTGDDIPRTYMVYDNLDTPTTYAMGTLWKGSERKPDKVQFCYWPHITGNQDWEYQIQSEQFGDSAVTVYFNPETVSSGAGMTVSTYYGTNLSVSDTDDSNESDIDVSEPLKDNEFAVITMDYATRTCLENVNITARNQTVKTDKKGRAVFSADGLTNDSKINIKLELEGYKTSEVEKKVSKGRTVCIYMKKTEDAKPLVTDVTMTSSKAGSKYNNVDLLAQQVYFNANKTNIQADNSNKETLTITVKSDTDNCVYKLLKDNDVIESNDTGVFKLDSVTKDKNGNNFNLNRICDIDAGQNISVQVVSKEGKESSKTLLGIKVSLPSEFSTKITDKVEFSGKIKLKLPDEDIMKILLGDDEYEAGPDLLPIEIEVDQDGKVKVSINGDKDKSWGEKAEEYQKAVLRRSDAARAFGGSPVSFGAGQASLEMNVVGYGEGWLENGQVNVNVGIVVSAKAGASYTRTFFVGWVPLYIKVGAEIGADGKFEASVIKDTKVKLTISQGSFEPSIALYAELGAGASGLLSAGVQGRGTLKYSADFPRSHYTLTLEAKASVEVHAVLFHGSVNIAKKTWTLYDSSAPGRSIETSEYASVLSDMYNVDSYELTPRDYLASASSSSDFDGVYVDAKPVTIYANDKAYRFWIRDNESRNELNRAELVYAVKDSAGSWSTATAINDDGKSDYNFDVYADGTKIYIVWQHSNTEFDASAGNDATRDMMNQMVASSEIYYAVLDTETNALSTPEQLTNDEKGDLAPKIVVSSAGPTVAWYSNENNIIVSDGSEQIGNSTIHYRVKKDNAWSTVINVGVGATLVTNMDIGILNGKAQIAYSMDKDGNLATVADRELNLVSELEASSPATTKITEETYNASMDENPRFTTIGGENALVWFQDNNIVYTTTAPASAEKVFDDKKNPAPSSLNCEFAVIDGTEPYILWTGISQDSSTDIDDPYYISIYAAKKTDSGWSDAFEWAKISDVQEPTVSYLSGYSVGDKVFATYAIAKYSSSGNVELSQIKETSGTQNASVELVSFDYSENDTSSGGNINMEITLHNNGNTALSDFSVRVGNTATSLNDLSLAAGETRTVKAQVGLPQYSQPSELPFQITANDNVCSNSDIIYAGYTDIAAELGERTMLADKEYVTLVITNKSNVRAENVNVKIMADDVSEGAIVFDHNLDEGIDARLSYILLCPLDKLTEAKVGYIRVSTTSEERNKMNNETLIVLDSELPDLTDSFLFTIKSENEEAGTIDTDEYTYEGSYETNTRIPIRALPKPGFRFSHWETNNGGTFENPQAEETVFVMPAGNVEITACFVSESIGLTAIALGPNPLELGVGEELQLSVTFTPSNLGIGREDLKWESSNPEIVTVDYTGYVAAKACGEATITATFQDTITATCNIKVDEVKAERIRFIYPEVTLSGIGTTKKLELMVMPQDATPRITYSAENPSVIDIDDDGVVTAIGLGISKVYAVTTSSTGEELRTECSVSVIELITKILISDSSMELDSGEEEELHINVEPANATNLDAITWESSDPQIVSVTPKEDRMSATVKALSPGTAYISVKAGNISRFCRITVVMQQTHAVMLKNTEYRFTSDDECVAKFELDMEACEYEDLQNVEFKLYGDDDVYFEIYNPNVTVNYEEKSIYVTFSTTDSRPEYERDYYLTAIDGTKTESESTRILICGYQAFDVDRISDQIYTGKAIKPKVNKVMYHGSTLTEEIDYTLTYESNPISTGTHYVTIVGKQGSPYAGKTQRVRYYICYDLSKTTIKKITNAYYTGQPLKPSLTVQRTYKVNKRTYKTTVSSAYYQAVYSENINLGTATVTIIGKADSEGNKYYTGMKKAIFKIVKRPVQSCVSIDGVYAQYYTGQAIKPDVTVYDYELGKTMLEGTDYTIKYSNNVNKSKNAKNRAKITITGKGMYTGKYTYSFYIYARPIGTGIEEDGVSVVVGDNNTAVYNKGRQLKPGVVVKYNGKTLKKNKDYTLKYGNNKDGAGAIGTVQITGKGNYSGEIRKEFKIVNGSVSKYTVSLSTKEFEYDGTEHRPEVTVKKGSATLTEGTDYEVSYRNAVNAGNATVTVKGISNEIGGSKSVTYKIKPKDVTNDAELTTVTIPKQNYTGNPVTPTVIVRYKGVELGQSDYTVAYSSNTKVTTNAKATLKFKGNYKGKKDIPFEIASWIFNQDTISVEIKRPVYTGKALAPEIKVMDAASGNILKKGSAYTLEWTNNVNAGKATVTIKPKNMSAESVAVTKNVIIKKASASGMTISKMTAQKYKGEPIKPRITVKYNKKKLQEGVDYKLVYRNNVQKGKASIDIIGMGNFYGSRTCEFVIY